MKPQCKNRAEVLKQAARCLEEFGEGAVCKYEGERHLLGSSGFRFDQHPSLYEFPLAKIEGKWVWRDSVGIFYFGSLCSITEDGKLDKDGRKFISWSNPHLSWNPPTPPKRTVLVNGEEMPLPTEKKGAGNWPTPDDNWMSIRGRVFVFNTKADKNKWYDKLCSLFEGKP